MTHKLNFTIRDLYYEFINLNISLKKADVYQILEWLLNKDYSDIISDLDLEVAVDQGKLSQVRDELKSGKPLAYILKRQYFYKRDFFVDERVLIPRPETELIIEMALNWIGQKTNLVIGDICTGSGILGITLSIETMNQIICTDISEAALTVAQTNAKNLQTTKIEFYQGDFLQPIIERNCKLNLLATNPPYIDYQDPDVGESVKAFEPHLALFADNAGLKFYQTLVDNLEQVMDLSQPFATIMEFGWKQKPAIEKILQQSKLEINWEFVRDYAGNWRCVIITNR